MKPTDALRRSRGDIHPCRQRTSRPWSLAGLQSVRSFLSSLHFASVALAVTSGFSDVELVRSAIGQVPFFEVLPVVGFSLLLAVAGDLIFAGRNPGYGKIILLIVVGALLTPMVGIAAYLEMQERVTGVQTADSGYWAALEVVTFFICLLIVASLKSTMFAQEILERTLAEAGIAQDNHG